MDVNIKIHKQIKNGVTSFFVNLLVPADGLYFICRESMVLLQ